MLVAVQSTTMCHIACASLPNLPMVLKGLLAEPLPQHMGSARMSMDLLVRPSFLMLACACGAMASVRLTRSCGSPGWVNVARHHVARRHVARRHVAVSHVAKSCCPGPSCVAASRVAMAHDVLSCWKAPPPQVDTTPTPMSVQQRCERCATDERLGTILYNGRCLDCDGPFPLGAAQVVCVLHDKLSRVAASPSRASPMSLVAMSRVAGVACRQSRASQRRSSRIATLLVASVASVACRNVARPTPRLPSCPLPLLQARTTKVVRVSRDFAYLMVLHQHMWRWYGVPL